MRRKQIVSLEKFILLLLLVLSARLSARAQQSPDLSALVSDVSKELEKSHVKNVVVFDFTGPENFVSVFGRNLADEFSDALAKSESGFTVIDRTRVKAAIESDHFPLDTVPGQVIASYLADELGAESELIGRLTHYGESLQLTLDCFRVKDGEKLSNFGNSFAMTAGMKSSLATRSSPISLPTCVHCQNPSFTAKARAYKTQGVVLLMVIIGADGKVNGVKVVKGLPDGLTLSAVNAVQNWTFRPAKASDGKAVEVRMVVEVSFRLY